MIDETVRTTGEGSQFTAKTAAVLVCDRVYKSNDGKRPLLLAVCATGGAARAVAACVRRAGELEVPGRNGPGKYELLKSADYQVSAQHVLGGAASVIQWHLPDVFALDPGARDSEETDAGEGADSPPFVVMPSALELTREREALGEDRAEAVVEWLLTRTAVLSGDVPGVATDSARESWNCESRFTPSHKHNAGDWPAQANNRAEAARHRTYLRDAIAWAPLVAAYVDRRVTVPAVRDLRYQALVLATLIELGCACWPGAGWGESWGSRTNLRAVGLESLGWATPFLCAPRGAGLLDQIAVECVAGFEAAERGGRRAHALAVIASRAAHDRKLAAARAAAAKRKS